MLLARLRGLSVRCRGPGPFVHGLADVDAVVQHPVDELLVVAVAPVGRHAPPGKFPGQFGARADLDEPGEDAAGMGRGWGQWRNLCANPQGSRGSGAGVMSGKPHDLTEGQKAEVETLAAVLTTEQIADFFGIGRRTFYSIMERDEEIAARYEKGTHFVAPSISLAAIPPMSEQFEVPDRVPANRPPWRRREVFGRFSPGPARHAPNSRTTQRPVSPQWRVDRGGCRRNYKGCLT